MNSTKHRLALVMIVRDEARCLARCLDSVRDLVDEMLVVDTGSLDDTPAIAVAAGARIAHLAWPDDFAAARNHALSLVDAPWRLVLDADEWIASGGECLAELRSTAPDFIGLVTVCSQIRDEFGVTQQSTSRIPRLLPAGALYEGRIHEQPNGPGLRRRSLSLRIGHDGYLPAQMEGKRGRNRLMLQAALDQQPDDVYLAYQLGKDLEIDGAYREAIVFYERCYAATADVGQLAWRHDLVLRLLFTLKKLARFDAALRIAERERSHWLMSPDYFFTVGDVLLDAAMAEPQRAPERLPLIERAWLRAIEIGERPDLPDSVHGRGSFLAAQNLAAFHEALGRPAEARRWRDLATSWRTRHASAG